MSDFIINVKENKHNLVAFMNQNNPNQRCIMEAATALA